MPKNSKTVIKTTHSSSHSGASSPAGGNYVQRGQTVTTVRETERKTIRNKNGDSTVKTKVRTVYYVGGKEVKLNWFDRLRIRFMSNYEKQAFLADKLLKQERRGVVVKSNKRK